MTERIKPDQLSDGDLLMISVELKRQIMDLETHLEEVNAERARRMGRSALNVIPFPARGLYAEGGDAS